VTHSDVCWRRVMHGRHRRAALVFVLLWLSVSPGAGQNVTESSLKAAFIYNFAKFTEWPLPLAPVTAPFVICVLGDPAVGDALERTTKGRAFAGHDIAVMQMMADAPVPSSCHMLYVSGVSAAQSARIVTAVQSLPVLTISDAEQFVRHGGITQFFVEGGAMRFCISAEAAKRARLQLSSKLLALGRCLP